VRALVIGYHAWDVLVPCAELPPRDGKRACPGMTAAGGGPAATAAVALARLGVAVRYVGLLPDDGPGRLQAEELTAAGVDLTLAVPAPGARSPLAVSLVDPGTGGRRILWDRGDLRTLRADEADPAWLDDADLLLADTHEPAAALVLARAAAARGLPAVLDAGTPRPGARELAAACSDVIAAAGFARAVSGHSDPRRALSDLRALGPRRVATTCGERGALALDADGFRHVPAFAVRAVDTTGAGDAFHAGYAWGLLRGEDFSGALDCGAAVAAAAVGALGGRAALPAPEAVLRLRAEGRRHPVLDPADPAFPCDRDPSG